MVHVTCDTGYEIHGDQHITCLPDGTWSKFTRCTKKGRVTITTGHIAYTVSWVLFVIGYCRKSVL